MSKLEIWEVGTDFQPEPNWRSMYEAEKKAHGETKKNYTNLAKMVSKLEKEMSMPLDEILEMIIW